MERLVNLIDKLKSFRSELEGVIRKVVKDNEYVILNMVTEEQLYEKGINSRGVTLGSFAPYERVTIEIKREKHQPTDRVTLRDTGEFHDSFYIEYKRWSFEIKARDWKYNMLIKGYGPDIMGLTDEHFREFAIDYVLPYIIEKFKDL